MIFYHLHIALKSIRSTPGVSLITILAIGLGIAVSTSMISLYYIMSQDPIPHKSERIYSVRLDNWDLKGDLFNVKPGEPPKQITWQDMDRICKSEIPKHYTGVINASVYAFPEKDRGLPFQAQVTLCHQGFFPLFDVPFRYGGGWSQQEQKINAAVVVLSHDANQRLFGGEDSVGRSLRLGPQTYTIVGVMASWLPTPNFYDVINNPYRAPNDVFMPIAAIRDSSRGLTATGDADSQGPGSSFTDFLFTSSERCCIQYWVEWAPLAMEAYFHFIDNYVR